jgi:hypothetical protein
MEFLFELYEKYTANLFTKEKVKKSVKKATGKAKEQDVSKLVSLIVCKHRED